MRLLLKVYSDFSKWHLGQKYFREQEKRVYSSKIELKRKFWRSIVINQTLAVGGAF